MLASAARARAAGSRFERLFVGAFALAMAFAAPAARGAESEAERAALARCESAAREDRSTCFARLLETARAPAVRAEAHLAQGDLPAANTAFRVALEDAPESVSIRVRWARLFLRTHQRNDAATLFREALDRDPDDYDAKLGLAESLLDDGPEEARGLLVALAASAGERPEAHLWLAHLAAERGDLAAADAGLARAAEQTAAGADCAPASLRAHAIRAGIALVRAPAAGPALVREIGDIIAGLREGRSDPPGAGAGARQAGARQGAARGRERGLGGSAEGGEPDALRHTRAALACDPGYGEVLAVPAHYLTLRRRYDEAIALLERAVAVAPKLWRAHADLATGYLRRGELGRARTHLEMAYAGDPYDPVVTNTLRLLDTLDGFRALPTKGEHFELLARLDPAEADVLAPYVAALTERAVATFRERYRFTPSAPIEVELYPNHDDFAVRTAGLPGLGLLGVTFGYVVAMDSPAARRPDEDVHWGSVLWHELAHVFTLEATRHHVPRWFSEGISVFEEWTTGPAPRRELSPAFLAAHERGTLRPTSELDAGFVSPRYPGEVGVSYLQAGLLCEYVARRWSVEKLADILHGFRSGESTDVVLPRVLAIELAELDAGFFADVSEEVAAVRAARSELAGLREQMQGALEAQRWSEVIASAQRAIQLSPEDVGATSPYPLLAEAYAAQGETAPAIAALEAYVARGGSTPDVLSKLAEAHVRNGDREAAIRTFERIPLVDPYITEVHERLGDLLLEADRGAAALAEYRVLLALDPHDRAAVHYRIARAHHQLGQPDETRRALLLALELAPRYRDAQRLLLEIRER